VFRYLFAEDIFISYSREDGTAYATALAEQLGRRGFNCIIDVYSGIAQADIPRALVSAAAGCYQLVLVATRGATASPNIAKEIEAFPRHARGIIVIGFGEPLDAAVWGQLVRGVSIQQDSEEARATGQPSPQIVNLIESAFRFRKQKQRLARTFWTTLAAIGTLIAGGFLAVAWFRAAATEQQRIAGARRTATDIEMRRSELGFTAPENVMLALGAAADLIRAGLPREAFAAVSDSTRLLPKLARQFDAGGPWRLAEIADEWLVLADGGPNVRLWDYRNARDGPGPLVHDANVVRLVAAGDGRTIVTVTDDGAVHVWDAQAGSHRNRLPAATVTIELDRPKSAAPRVTVSQTGRFLGLEHRNSIQILDLTNGSELGRIEEESGAPRQLVFSDDEKRAGVVWVEENEAASIHTLAPGLPGETLDRACVDRQNRATFARNGRLLATSLGRYDDLMIYGRNSVRVCQIPSAGAPVQLPHMDQTRTEFSHDGAVVATTEGDTIRLWSADRGRLLATIRAPDASARVMFSSDDRYLAAAGKTHVWLVESPSGFMAAVLPQDEGWDLLGLSRGADLMVFGHAESGRVRVWQTRGIFGTTFPLRGRATRLQFTPDGSTLSVIDRVALEGEETLHLQRWNLASGGGTVATENEGDFFAIADSAQRIAYLSPNTSSNETSIRLRDLAGRQVEGRTFPWLVVNAVHHPVAGWLGVVCTDAGLELRELERKDAGAIWTVAGVQKSAERDAVRMACYYAAQDGRQRFLRNGRLLLAQVDKTARIFDLDRRREANVHGSFAGAELLDVTALDGGGYLAAVRRNGRVDVVDVEAGTTRTQLSLAGRRVALSADGRFIAASEGRTASIWEVSTGQELVRRRYAWDPTALAFSADGRYLAVGSNLQVDVARWMLDDVRRDACSVLAANRTSEVWAKVADTRLESVCQ
jgi:WD40 repeat protein